jgi:hypothetical protein
LNFLLTYTAVAQSVSTTQMADAMSVFPRDTYTEELLGLQTGTGGGTSVSGAAVTLTISLSPTAYALINNSQFPALLTNFYTRGLADWLSTPVVAGPVGTS